MTACAVPPQGWICSRVAGHDGPCAARPRMTHPIKRASVEQADREAAGFVAEELMGNLGFAHSCRGGHADDYRLVQAFARHRQQAHDAGFAEGVVRAASMAKLWKSRWATDFKKYDDQFWEAGAAVAEQIETFIATLSTEANEWRCDG